MKRKVILIFVLLLIIILIIAAITKPDDKKIKIIVIDALWGNKVPNKLKAAQYYEEFMNLTTQDIDIDDWLFLKRIKYNLQKNTTTIGYAAFGRVMLNK